MEEKKSDIEAILAERRKLDERLKNEFTRKVTVMFTDIKGSTSFYEQRGDVDGRLMVHRHNELVLPLISENKGKLIKTIGDATMSIYDDAADGVRAALQIQQRLRDHNKTSAAGEQIHVRIGVNTGMGIVEEKDVFGDVVNVAARVESLADGGEIYVTEDTYRELKNHDEFIFRYADAAKVRGKKDALKAYRLVWHEEALHMGVTRKGPQAAQKKEGVLVLEASVAGKNLKISAFVRSDGEERTVKNYRETAFQEEKIGEYTKGMIEVLNRANRRGKIGNELLVKMKEIGGLLFDLLVPVEFKKMIAETRESCMTVSIDDSLVHIPWELLYDGKDFLCQRFSLGRSVSTRQNVSVVARALHRPLKMQILADPRGDLRAAYEEGVAIKNEVGSFEDWIDVSLKTSDITADYAKGKIRNFDIVHYAGHAEHNAARPDQSGWLLKDGRLSAADIMVLAGTRPMPSLVFSNACQTGQTDAWKLDADYGTKIFGVANAFLLTGVQHYIGTFWEIPDEAGALFAKSFYGGLVSGAGIGEALRQARRTLIDTYGEDTIVWAGYMLYGDPTTRYAVADQETQPAAADSREAPHEQLQTADLRGPGHATVMTSGPSRRTIALAGGAALVAAAVLAAFFFMGRGSAPQASMDRYQGAATQAPTGNVAPEKRLDELVTSLAQQYRSGSVASATITDEWSSRPITMVFMDVKAEGANAEKQIGLLSNRVAQALGNEGRVQMVERELLQKLLEELKLSASNLADSATALKLGKLLSARIMVAGGILPEKKGLTISLRFIDTETSAVRKVLTIDTASSDIDREAGQTVANGISEWVKADFPVRGRVTTLAGDTCMVNVGQIHGVKKGDRLELVKEAKKGSGLFAVTGELEITELQKDKAQAKIVSKAETIKEGSTVRGKI